MECKKCGRMLPENAKFCLECGTKVEKELEKSADDMINNSISNKKYWLTEQDCAASSGVTEIVVYEGINKEVVRVRIGDLSLDSVYLYDVRNDNIIIKCVTRFGEEYYVVCNLTNKVVDRYYSKERIVEVVGPITDGWLVGNVYIKKLNN